MILAHMFSGIPFPATHTHSRGLIMKNFRFSSSLFLTGFFCMPSPSPRERNSLSARVRNDHDFSYSQVPVTAGIPVPRDRDIRSTGMFNIETAEGETVPSQFQVTARWGGTRTRSISPLSGCWRPSSPMSGRGAARLVTLRGRKRIRPPPGSRSSPTPPKNCSLILWRPNLRSASSIFPF